MILAGRSATGKTRTAFELLRCQWVDFGRDFLFIGHREVETTAQSLANGGAYFRWLDQLVRVPILLIDDLGKSNFVRADGTPKAAEEIIFATIDQRINRNLPTILTMNASVSGLSGLISR